MRRQIGSIFQDFKLLPNKTVNQNVAFALEVIGTPKQIIRNQVPAILELVGLHEKTHRFPHELSGGEQQRVSIARAFVNRPLILLADEPTGNLDPELSVDILTVFEQFSAVGVSILIASHDSALLSQFGHRTLTLDHGKLSPHV